MKRRRMAEESLKNLKKGVKFKPGQSGNPKGGVTMPPEIKAMKEASLKKAIEILYTKIHDEEYIGRLQPRDLNQFIETAFDRFGLPKVTKAEVTGQDGGPVVYKCTWEK